MSKSTRSKGIAKNQTDRQRHRPPAPAHKEFSRKQEIAILTVILLVAALLRLMARDSSPPGLNQDEAVNGWNAWCLLNTGKDQTGLSWPLFYLRGLGSNYTPLNIYLLLPLQAIGGMNIWTTRATASLGGILLIFLIWLVGRRLVGPSAGLLAAGLLALNPWHLLTSRWGSEANLCPLLAILPLAMLLLAGLPPAYSIDRPKVIAAAIGGILTGLCLYGYPAIFIFLPLFMVAIAVLNWRQWLHCLGERRGLVAALAWAISLAIVFAPLAWQHAFHGPEIRKRAAGTWIWDFTSHNSEHPTFREMAGAVASRYVQHFGPDFLFLRGDHSSIESPPGMGMFHWYMLPLFVLGLIWCVRNFATSPAARVILAWVLLYPIGDSFAWSVGDDQQLCLHALRSSPGIGGLVLLAAVGANWAGIWLWNRSRSFFWGVTAATALVVAWTNILSLSHLFGEYNRRPFIYHKYHVDLVAASRWLKPRSDQYAAVFCTTDALAAPVNYLRTAGLDLPLFIPDAPINQPYIIMLHELGYDPHQWLVDSPVMSDPDQSMFNICLRFGKVNFLYPPQNFEYRNGRLRMGSTSTPLINELQANGKPDRALFILRPGEEKYIDGLENLGPPVLEIKRPDGVTSLVLREKTI